MSSEKTNITWSEEHQHLAELVVKKHAGRMGELGIPTRSATRPGGQASINRSGAILMALKLAAGEAASEEAEELPQAIPGDLLIARIDEMDIAPEDVEALTEGLHEARQVDHAKW